MAKLTPTWDPIADTTKLIIGIDEVGRGAWAGPVVAAATILPHGLIIPGLADSKLVSAPLRRQLDRHIRHHALAVGIGWVTAGEIDAHGLSWAVRHSGLRALAGLGLDPDPARHLIILDGRDNYLAATHHSQAIIKADALITPVAAASIIAKVARDRYMQTLARQYPDYGFEQHVGYGTAAHTAALQISGLSPHHRRSYKPIQRLLDAAR